MRYQIWHVSRTEQTRTPEGLKQIQVFDGVEPIEFDTEAKAQKYINENNLTGVRIAHSFGDQNSWRILDGTS